MDCGNTVSLSVQLKSDIAVYQQVRRPQGCPCATCMWGIDADVWSVNIGMHSTWWKANDHVL